MIAVLKLPAALWNRPIARAFRTAPTGVAALVVLSVLFVIAAISGPLWHDESEKLDLLRTNAQPSWDHLLGTDGLGRDVFYRLLVATRLSILLALASAGIGFVLGVTIGASAVLLGPRLRTIVLRAIDTMLSFPGLLTAIFVSVVIGVGIKGAMIGVGIAISFSFARVTSTLALSVGGREYINAARTVGVRGPRLMLRYVLPNIAEPLIITTSVAVGLSIVAVAALSFLGLGVQPPSVDWGRMMTDGVKTIYLTPAAAVGPSVAIALTAVAFGLTGEALARAMNPLLWTPENRSRSGAAGATDHVEPDPALERVPADEGSTLDVRDLVVTFPGPDGPIDVVKGVSFSVPSGELIGIVGESGSGKTMTALAIAQLTPFPGRVGGTVTLQGKDLRQLPKGQLDTLLGTRLAVVFQDPMSSLNPALTVGKQLTEGVRTHRKLPRKTVFELAVQRLTEVHIAAPSRQMRRYPHEFSGGMRQRAMIAMGLMNEPLLLIADEPTTALDVTIQAQIMDLLNEVNETHKTAVILISHNLALVAQNCHRILVMYAGRIVEDLDVAQLKTDPQHPYTRALLAAVPELGQSRHQPLAYIPGEAPNLGDLPPGCPFHPRCPLAVERCRTERPALLTRPAEDGRRVACHVANDGVVA